MRTVSAARLAPIQSGTAGSRVPVATQPLKGGQVAAPIARQIYRNNWRE